MATNETNQTGGAPKKGTQNEWMNVGRRSAAEPAYTMAEWRERLDAPPAAAAADAAVADAFAPAKPTPAYQPPHKRAGGGGAAQPPISDKFMQEWFSAIKQGEADMVAADAKRVADAAAAGEPVKELTLDEILALRRKFNPRDDDWCPATKSKHTWGPLHHSGNSWHGPVYGKNCTSCGHSWCSH